jgi:hypothetical protein
VGVGLGVAVALSVGVGVELGVAVALSVGVGVELVVGVGVGVGAMGVSEGVGATTAGRTGLVFRASAMRASEETRSGSDVEFAAMIKVEVVVPREAPRAATFRRQRPGFVRTKLASRSPSGDVRRTRTVRHCPDDFF